MRVPIGKLATIHPEYEYYWEVWANIDALREGATAILRNREYYLPKSVDEDDELYSKRLSKFTYTPVMANAIREFVAKLASSPIHLSDGSEEPFWQYFRSHTDGNDNHSSRDESELLLQLFSSILYFGRLYISVELPKLSSIPRTKAEVPANYIPYALVHEPLAVINWGEGWFVTRYLYVDSEPFQEPVNKVRYTLYQYDKVSSVELECKTSTRLHQGLYRTEITEVLISGTWHPVGNSITPTRAPAPNVMLGGILQPPQGVMVDLEEYNIPGVRPITARLKDEEWAGKAVYLKQKAHTLIENSWIEAGSIAGVVQRVYTPLDPPPVDDPRYTYQQPDYSELSKSGNKHILVGKSYQFVEAQGSAVSTLEKQLSTLESQIRSLVSMRFASSDTSVLSQSGVSKQVDMVLLNDAMKAYGKVILGVYNDILTTIAEVAKQPPVTASGLNNYSISTLADMLEYQAELASIELPPTVARIWLQRLGNLLTGSTSPEDAKAIQDELQAMFQNTPDDNGSQPVTIEELMEEFGLTEEQAREVLGDG